MSIFNCKNENKQGCTPLLEQAAASPVRSARGASGSSLLDTWVHPATPPQPLRGRLSQRHCLPWGAPQRTPGSSKALCSQRRVTGKRSVSFPVLLCLSKVPVWTKGPVGVWYLAWPCLSWEALC